MAIGMTGTHRDESRHCVTSTGTETNVVGLPWGCKRNTEMNMHFTVMLLLQCLQWNRGVCNGGRRGMGVLALEHSDSDEKNSIRFDSIHADESIFRFGSIRFDSTI